MKYKKILCWNFTGRELDQVYWDRIDKLCKQRKFARDINLEIELRSADCLLIKLGAKVGREIINKAKDIKYIGMFGTGCGGVDLDYAKNKGITVCNVEGYSTEGVAELAFGLILEHVREITRAKLQGEKGNYSESGFSGYEIKGKKFGVIGLGRIGGRIAEIAKEGFGAKVYYWSKHRKVDFEKRGIFYKRIEQVLSQSDFLSINLEYNKKTKKFLDKKRIEKIKPGSVVLNLAPMELIDIGALAQRLKRKDITFILDHSDELSKKDAKKLSKFKNCIMYPPIGYITKEATKIKQSIFVTNLKNFLINGRLRPHSGEAEDFVGGVV